MYVSVVLFLPLSDFLYFRFVSMRFIGVESWFCFGMMNRRHWTRLDLRAWRTKASWTRNRSSSSESYLIRLTRRCRSLTVVLVWRKQVNIQILIFKMATRNQIRWSWNWNWMTSKFIDRGLVCSYSDACIFLDFQHILMMKFVKIRLLVNCNICFQFNLEIIHMVLAMCILLCNSSHVERTFYG